MANIKCPKCGAMGYFSLAQPTYQGPFRCAKCKELFTIRVENDELKSCEPLSQEDLDKLKTRKFYQ